MKKLILVFLFIIFSSSFSLAKNSEKITVEEIENVFFKLPKPRTCVVNCLTEEEKINWLLQRKMGREKRYKKRVQKRGIARCTYAWMDDDAAWGGDDPLKQCYARAVRGIITYSEKSKKKRPGDIFFALEAIEGLVGDGFLNTNSSGYLMKFEFIKMWFHVEEDKSVPGMVCGKPGIKIFSNDEGRVCAKFKKRYLKKFEKFKKDPSNEKVLGKELINYIKQVRMVNGIRDTIGADDTRGIARYTSNYALLGDMLNATVVDVKKNNISPDLKKRRVFLKRYSLILRGIKKKLNEDNYKSIDKDVSKLSKTHEDLKALTTTTNKMVMNIDEAVDGIFDTNKLIQKSVLDAKDNEEEKLLALSSIYFMQSLIDSILSTIPEKYYVETEELPLDLFSEYDLSELEGIIDTMTNKNKEIKSAKLTESMGIVNKYVNTSDVLKKLDDLNMKNSSNRALTQNTVNEIAIEQIRNNLDSDILKSVSKILQSLDKNELAELTKEASNIASEVASSSSVKEATSGSILDKKIGNFTVKQLIGACRSRGNC